MNVQTPVPAPSAADIRAMLARVTGSAAFRSSPQLAAFLRLVVEMTLRGEADRIKAYTIAADALGRDQDFDPARDPIVRVEANRLRRALAVYYDGDGADDPIIIDIAPGRYVPSFRLRSAGGAPTDPRAGPRRRFRRPLALGAAVLALLLVLAVVAARRPASSSRPVEAGPAPVKVGALAGAPRVLIEPIQALPASASPLAAALDHALARAATNFPNLDIRIVPAAARAQARDDLRSAARPTYRLTGFVEAPPGRRAGATLELVTDGVIAWTRDWRIGADGQPTPGAIAREASTELFAVFGVIHARLRARSNDLAPGFRCVLAAADYLRTLDMAQHERVRDCLEQTVAADPKVATALAVLALVYEREYLIDLPPRPGEPPPLERAVRTAQRALAVDPDNAVVQVAAMDSHYLQGDLAGARVAGRRAMAINPLDPAITAAVGFRLVLGGDIEHGAPLLEKADSLYGTKPGWLYFGLFCVAYLKGDRAAAAHYANLQGGDNYPFGMVARALVAAAAGDRTGAQKTLVRLTALYPGWHAPKEMLRRFVKSEAIVDRVAGDLAAIAGPSGDTATGSTAHGR